MSSWSLGREVLCIITLMMIALLILLSAISIYPYDKLFEHNSMHIGERLNIDGRGVKKIEISNKKIIKVLRSANKTLTIEAKSKGNVVIYIWERTSNEAKQYRFTVLPGTMLKRSAGIKDALKGVNGVKISSTSDTVYITGLVSKKEDFELIERIAASEKNVVSYVRMDGSVINAQHSRISSALLELGLYDVTVRQADGLVIVEANARNKKTLEHAEHYLKSNHPGIRWDLRLVPYQIDIDVKIVEVNNNEKRELGLETPSELSLSRHTVLSRIEVDSILHLYDGRGSAKIVSNPSLSANDGEAANFHVGGSIPIKLSSRYSTSMDWKDYGVLLNFTPKVINEDTVELSISSEFSSLDQQGAEGQTPGLLIRGVKTVVTMDSGKSVVISGLLSRISSRSTYGLPVVSDIPVISDIFANNNNSLSSTELAIIVTPSIRLKCEELLIDKRLESLLIESLQELEEGV